jgi:DNA-binding transcriptional MocR family regulator
MDPDRINRLARVVRTLDSWSVASGPIYIRLTEALREAIERNDLPPGTRLPAERALAQALAVSRGTVIAAYDNLRQEALIERRQGSGSWVNRNRVGSRMLSAAGSTHLDGRPVLRSLTETPHSSIDFLGAHLPGDGIPWREVLANTAGDLSLAASGPGYTPAGLPALRRAIAEQLLRSGLPTSEAEVLVTSGAQQAISLLAALYIRAGDTVILENPTYPGAIDAFLERGARLAPVAVGPDGARVSALRDALRASAASLVYLVPTFQNPTGTVMPPAHRADVVRSVEESGTPLIEDATLASLTFGPPPPRPLAAAPGTATIFTIGSLGKIFWGGLRVGWIRAPEPVVSALARLKAISDLGTSIPAQLMAIQLFAHAEAVAKLRQEQIRTQFDLLEQLLLDLLPSWSWKRPAGGLSLWVQLPKGKATEFSQVALRHGVAVAPGPLMSPNNRCDDHIRIAFMRESDLLVEGVRRLAAAWHEYDTSPRLRAATPHVLL